MGARRRSNRHAESGGPASAVTRRAVLKAGTVGAAAVGMVGAFPGVLSGLAASGPELSGAAADAPEAEGLAATELSAPIVAHITDASAGELSVYVGEREITYRDPQLVQRLIRAGR